MSTDQAEKMVLKVPKVEVEEENFQRWPIGYVAKLQGRIAGLETESAHWKSACEVKREEVTEVEQDLRGQLEKSQLENEQLKIELAQLKHYLGRPECSIPAGDVASSSGPPQPQGLKTPRLSEGSYSPEFKRPKTTAVQKNVSDGPLVPIGSGLSIPKYEFDDIEYERPTKTAVQTKVTNGTEIAMGTGSFSRNYEYDVAQHERPMGTAVQMNVSDGPLVPMGSGSSIPNNEYDDSLLERPKQSAVQTKVHNGPETTMGTGFSYPDPVFDNAQYERPKKAAVQKKISNGPKSAKGARSSNPDPDYVDAHFERSKKTAVQNKAFNGPKSSMSSGSFNPDPEEYNTPSKRPKRTTAQAKVYYGPRISMGSGSSIPDPEEDDAQDEFPKKTVAQASNGPKVAMGFGSSVADPKDDDVVFVGVNRKFYEKDPTDQQQKTESAEPLPVSWTFAVREGKRHLESNMMVKLSKETIIQQCFFDPTATSETLPQLVKPLSDAKAVLMYCSRDEAVDLMKQQKFQLAWGMIKVDTA